jgi:hypothetical protein
MIPYGYISSFLGSPRPKLVSFDAQAHRLGAALGGGNTDVLSAW